ncbi:MAG: nicotinate-nicotinamide nucleotide adenylyltransferase, partial [Gemmatimonadales bacterium]
MVDRPVGLFGGSFDPVHHGHLIVARAALEELGLAEVRFIPAREQPFKQGRHQASAADRAEMLRLAIAGEPGFRVDTLELDRPGPSYTVDTLRQLTAQEPSRTFILLLGADA